MSMRGQPPSAVQRSKSSTYCAGFTPPNRAANSARSSFTDEVNSSFISSRLAPGQRFRSASA